MALTLVFVALLPVPWLVARTPNPPGMAWSLDGRLQFNGQTIDPPGQWYGLTAGRPPVLAEVIWSWVDSDTEKPRDMRGGSRFDSPAMAEPVAIALGLAEAGIMVDVSTFVEARHPLVEGLPARASISMLNGHTIVSQDDWARSIAELSDHNEFVTSEGRVHVFVGTAFPYQVVEVRQAPSDLEVSLAGWGRLIPVSWYRELTLGKSHGLLLALAAYSQASEEDLARGRAVAGTGVVREDGTVAAIGGLAAKVRAAHRAGVDVMVYPAAQRCQLEAAMESNVPIDMRMIPVGSLPEAIELLRSDALPNTDDVALCGA